MDTKKIPLILLILLLLDVTLVAGILIYQWLIDTNGTVKTVNVECYWDEENTQPVSSLDWGIMEPNETKTQSFYVRSLSNVPVNLTMTTSNWIPMEAQSYIVVTWDAENVALLVDEQILVTMTLTIDPAVENITGFSFKTIIEAVG